MVTAPGRTRKLETGVGTVRTLQVVPAAPVSDTPLIVAPGWIEVPQHFRPLIRHLACTLRRPVIAFKHFRYGGYVDPARNGAYKEAYRRAETLLAVVRRLNRAPVDVVTHSEASIYATLAAQDAPTQFNHLVYLVPAGLASLRLSTLAWRALIELVRQIGGSGGLDSPLRGLYENALRVRELLVNPIRSMREVRAIAHVALGDRIREVRRRGVRVSIVHGNEDRLIRIEEVTAYLQANSIEVDGFYEVEGEHGFPLHAPEATARVVRRALQKA